LGRAPPARARLRRLVRTGAAGTDRDDGHRAAPGPRLSLPVVSRPAAVELPRPRSGLPPEPAHPIARAPRGRGDPRTAGLQAGPQIARAGARRAPPEPHLHPLPGERPVELLVPQARAGPPDPVPAPLRVPAA